MSEVIRIQRLNMDTSWLLEWGNAKFVIDPWLVGSEIDGFKWFNEQWHATDPVAPDNIGSFEAIVISQSYADHCHLNTLKVMPAKPIFASPKAAKVLKGWKLPNKITNIGESVTIDGVTIHCLPPNRKIDPIYYAIVFSKGNDAILYASHGFEPTAKQVAFLQQLNIKLLITTLSEFKLPAILGGKVNPGMDNARTLVELIDPERIINTHDEKKVAKGLVKQLAKVQYPDYDNIEFSNFIPMRDYNPVTL